MRQSVAGHFTKIDICREVFALLGSDAVNLPIYRLPRGKVPFASDGVEIAFFASDTNFFAISPINNIYTKTEVDQKIAASTGLLIKGADADGTLESINAEINNTPDGFAKMFKSNYGGSYQMQTIFTIKLDTSRIFSLMFPKGSNLFRFQTAPNGTWYTICYKCITNYYT